MGSLQVQAHWLLVTPLSERCLHYQRVSPLTPAILDRLLLLRTLLQSQQGPMPTHTLEGPSSPFPEGF